MTNNMNGVGEGWLDPPPFDDSEEVNHFEDNEPAAIVRASRPPRTRRLRRTFPQFSSLPPELQDIIWNLASKYAMETLRGKKPAKDPFDYNNFSFERRPQNHLLSPYSHTQLYIDNRLSRELKHRSNYLWLLSTCRGSRRAALQHWIDGLRHQMTNSDWTTRTEDQNEEWKQFLSEKMRPIIQCLQDMQKMQNGSKEVYVGTS